MILFIMNQKIDLLGCIHKHELTLSKLSIPLNYYRKMDKIAKFLSKLNQKEQIVIFELLNQIILNEWKKLDYKKMI